MDVDDALDEGADGFLPAQVESLNLTPVFRETGDELGGTLGESVAGVEGAFDVERAREVARSERFAAIRVKKEGEEDGKEELIGRDKILVLANHNSERLNTLRNVVREYLDRSGRQWVDMGSLFGFMS